MSARFAMRHRLRPEWLRRLHAREMQRVVDRPELHEALTGFIGLASHNIRLTLKDMKTRKGWAL